MFAKNNKISSRQLFRLLTYELLGFGTLMIPTVLAKVSGRDGIFAIVVGVLFSLLYLKLLRKVFADMNGSYDDLIRQKLGNFTGNVILTGYLIYFVLLAGYVSYLLTSLVRSNLLADENFFLILFLILLVVLYGVWGGMEGRARVYEILFWFLMIPLFAMMLSALGEVDTDYWTPVFHTSLPKVAAGSYYVFLCFSLIFLTTFIRPYLPDAKKIYRSSRQAVLFAGTLIGCLYLILLGIFGSSALGKMDFPAVTMMSRVQMTGGFLKRTDAFMFGIWFFTLYALLCSAVFYGGTILSKTLQRKNKKLEKAVFILLLVAVYCCAWLFYHSNRFCNDYQQFLWYVGTPFVVLVPLLLVMAKRSHKGTAAAGMLVLLLSVPFLSGCKSTEVEDRTFPVMLAVSDTEDFCRGWYEQQKGGNRMVDYNHLKVILFEQQCLEDDAKMGEMLAVLQQDKNVPQNTYVLGTSEMKGLLELEEALGEPLGNYLEALLENNSDVKKDAYPTLGMLYQEKENRLETLFIPNVSILDGKPVISAYRTWQRGKAGSLVDTDTAMLSFFTENQLKEYTIQLACSHYVRLTDLKNRIELVEEIASNGITQKKIVIHTECDGELLYQQESRPADENREWLKEQLEAYFNATAEAALERQMDVTNSYKRLGGYQPQWYERYQNAPADYEKDICIVYEVSVNWKNL